MHYGFQDLFFSLHAIHFPKQAPGDRFMPCKKKKKQYGSSATHLAIPVESLGEPEHKFDHKYTYPELIRKVYVRTEYTKGRS